MLPTAVALVTTALILQHVVVESFAISPIDRRWCLIITARSKANFRVFNSVPRVVVCNDAYLRAPKSICLFATNVRKPVKDFPTALS